MTRVGWIVLIAIVAVIGAFASVTRFGTADRTPDATSAPTVSEEGHGALMVPVAGVARASVQDSWGDARGGGTRAHHGTDIMAPHGTPVVAAAPGTVEKLFQSRLGGTTVYVRSPAGGWVYYYAHLAGYAPGLHEGQRVRAGDLLAYVGDTGDAGPGNYHLHFGLQRMRAGERWWQGDDVNPYPLLAGPAAAR